MSATGTESRVCEDIAKRQQLGLQKYGTTVEQKPLGDIQWLKHAYEECLDQAVYLKRLIEVMEGVPKEEPFPVISTEELQAVSEIIVDPHAELRRAWKPEQRWQINHTNGTGWLDISGEPTWFATKQYRRHPEDKDEPTPWYPDDSGEWVEVPEDTREMPLALNDAMQVEVLFLSERRAKEYIEQSREVQAWEWDSSKEGDHCIVAYKVVK